MAYGIATIGVGILLCLLSLSVAASTGGGGNVYRLLVLHTNDMHAHFDQSNRDDGRCAKGQPCYGGFARVKTAVQQARTEADSDDDGTLFLNAGDTFQGTTFYSIFKWRVVAQMVQKLGIDVMSLGNHEFDDGVEDVQHFIHNITTPVVASNLDLSGEPLLANEPNLMKSKVLTVNGREIGIIGYLTPETKFLGKVGNVKLLPEIPSIAAEAKRLRNMGVNILIALGHSGFDTDLEIAKFVEDIDLVIGGHSNTFLYNGKAPDIEEPLGSYPFWVEQPKTNRRVPVVQAFHLTKYLGKLWIEFDEAGEIIKSHGNPILLDSHVEQDPELLNDVEILERLISVKTKQVIGSTSVFLEGTNEYCRTRECNFGNFIADAFVNYNIRRNINSFDLTKYWTNAPIAILQGGGIRANINSLRNDGNITFGDLMTSVPFQNDIGKIIIKGSNLWKALEFSVRRYSQTMKYGEFLQVSGLKFTIDLSQPSGKRVQSVYARCGMCTVPVYQKLDLNANYTIIVSNFMSNGGDGFKFEKLVDYQSIEAIDQDILQEELRLTSPISPELEQRIILLNADTPSTTSGQIVSTPLTDLTLLMAVVMYLANRLL